MRDAGNKEVMAKNLRFYMDEKNVTARDLSRALHFPYTTIVSWINGENYPRIDKIDAMAEYFGIMKSDLIEEKTEDHREMQKKNDALTDIVIRMQTDNDFLSAVEAIYEMEPEKVSNLLAFLK